MDAPRHVTSSCSMKQNMDKKCRINGYGSLTMDLHKTLCMQGGDDEVSYARNSEAPACAITLSKPLIIQAIQSMKLFNSNESLRIADLGCATGYNTLATIDMVVENLKSRYGQESICEPEFEAFFSDLPSNDFNSLFRSLPPMNHDSKRQYYAAGVPGSFYYRLFPKGKLHMAISLSALHWLSQIPSEVLDKRSKAWNKGMCWIDGANKEVIEAYAKQSEADLKAFLLCRKEEIAGGGMLFILMAGRPSSNAENQLGDPDSTSKHPFTRSMDMAWQDLLIEGMIDDETRDTFNIPAYMRSMDEVRKGFSDCNGFDIQRLEYMRIQEHSKEKQQEWIKDPVSYGRARTNLVRATLGPIVESHLGSHLSTELFNRYEKRVSEDIELLHKTFYYGIIVVSAIRNETKL